MGGSDKTRVLVVEAPCEGASALQKLVEDSGLAFAGRADSAAQAAACAKSRPFDLALLDCDQPGVSIARTCGAIQGGLSTPVVCFTRGIGPDILDAITEADPAGVVFHPIEPRLLAPILTLARKRFLMSDSMSGRAADLEASLTRRAADLEASNVRLTREVFERRQAEEALRQAEERYRTVADFTHDWEYWQAPDGSLLYVSPACERMTGHAPKDFQDDPDLLESIILPEDLPLWYEHVGEVQTARSCGRCRFRILHAGGGVRWIGHVCQPVLGKDGSFKGIRASNRDITPEVLALEELHRQESRNRLLLELLPAPIAISNLKSGDILYINQAARELLGLSRQDAGLTNALDLYVQPSERAGIIETITRQGSVRREAQMVDATGRKFTALISAVLMDYGDSPAVYSVILDVTARRKAQEALQESQDIFATFMDQTPAGVFLQDQDSRTRFVNRQVRILLGNDTDWLGKTPEELYPGDLGRTMIEDNRKALSGRMVVRDERLPSAAGGSVFWRTIRFPILREGKPPLVGGVSWDVSEPAVLNILGRAVNSAVTLDDIARVSMDSLADLLSLDLAILFLVHADALEVKAIRSTIPGYPDAKGLRHEPGDCLCGRAAMAKRSVFSRDIRLDPRCTRSECLTGGVTSYAALPLWVGPDLIGVVGLGSRRPRDFEVQAEFLESLAFIVSMGIHKAGLYEEVALQARDLDAKVAERTEELRESNRQMELFSARAQELAAKSEAASRAKSEFLAKMSHEIRTPMNAVVNMTRIVLDSPLTDKQREQLAMVDRASQHLLSIIEDILDFSRIEAGHMVLSAVTFGLEALLRSSLEPFAQQAAQKGIHLRCELPPDLPPAAKGDPNRLRQILTNLVGNAVKFTSRGGVTLSAEVEREAPGTGRFVLTAGVDDTGIGIPQDLQEHIFDLFRQADNSTSRGYGGTGLGLSIARQLAEMMGGDIAVRSAPGQGSRFTVRIPLVACDPAEAARAVPPARRSTPRPPSLRVLVVEDNEENKKVAQALLEKLGQRVTIAGGGEEALERLAREPFDVVFMDVEMPGMDGLEATRRIRSGAAGAAGGGVRILAMTAHAVSGYRDLCRDAGMDGYLTKPLDIAQLEQALRDATSERAPGPPPPPDRPKQTSALPTLDREEALRRLEDVDLFLEIFQLLVDSFPERRALLRGHLEAGRGQELASAAHALKGALAAVGAARSADLARQLEEAGRSGELSGLEGLLDQLDQEFEALHGLLEQDPARA